MFGIRFPFVVDEHAFARTAGEDKSVLKRDQSTRVFVSWHTHSLAGFDHFKPLLFGVQISQVLNQFNGSLCREK